ncbi:MAG: DUF4402 domain-containing protein [Rhodospirillales bacterium]|nr:DUF4402 domain-containing protein [Alphaproteobacteria bacterium]USO03981.1 MAG: DUF4402 domain-containing protein [Rhodospirillales bacterium]
MRTSVKKVLLGSTTLLALGVAGQPVEAATTGVPIQAIVLAPVQITQTRTLNFGSLTEAGVGTMVVDNLDAGTAGGGVTSIGGTIQAGGYTLKATAAAKVTVTAPANVSITETVGGVAKMTVSSFTFDGAAGPLTHTMVAATDTGLRLGGTLNVGAGQTTGTYTGSVTLTANYQ